MYYKTTKITIDLRIYTSFHENPIGFDETPMNYGATNAAEAGTRLLSISKLMQDINSNKDADVLFLVTKHFSGELPAINIKSKKHRTIAIRNLYIHQEIVDK